MNQDVVPFSQDSVKDYLDKRIRFWRCSKKEHSKFYVDAFQSVRVSLFGELLPLEKEEEGK